MQVRRANSLPRPALIYPVNSSLYHSFDSRGAGPGAGDWGIMGVWSIVAGRWSCEVHMGMWRIGVAALAMVAAGCSSTANFGPEPEEMRQALLAMLDEQPEISVPEFRNSLEYQKPFVQDGIVHFGVWNCDPKVESFVGLFSAPNITMYEISGRFQQDNRGLWRAIPRRVVKTQKRDVGEFWRAHEVEPR
jgi:hypothetical protein